MTCRTFIKLCYRFESIALDKVPGHPWFPRSYKPVGGALMGYPDLLAGELWMPWSTPPPKIS